MDRYKCEKLNSTASAEAVQFLLNEHSAAGWTLVTVLRSGYPETAEHVFIFELDQT